MSTSPLSSDERQKLRFKLLDIEDALFGTYFETGMTFDSERAHRAGLLEIKEQTAKLDAKSRRLRLEREAVERALRWGTAQQPPVSLRST